jgi:hypothetical protein
VTRHDAIKIGGHGSHIGRDAQLIVI